MSTRVRLLLLAVLIALASTAVLSAFGTAAATAGGQAGDGETTTPADVPAPNQTTFTIQLHEDGDATWTVSTRFDVETQAERAAFRTVASRFESGVGPSLGLDTFRSANDAADRITERPMALTDVERRTDVNRSTLSLRFEWTNFSYRSNDSLVVDDAFNTSNGTWFDSLAGNQVLIVDVPPGYGFLSAPKGPEGARIRWDGPQEFEPGYFRIEYSGDADGIIAMLPFDVPRLGTVTAVEIGLLAVAGVLAAAYGLSRRRGDRPIAAAVEAVRERVRAVVNPAQQGASASGTSSTLDETDAGRAASAGVAVGGDADADESTESGHGTGPGSGDGAEPTDEELLSDEERVETLLEENGGRMKQANIVKETGWSNAKVSQLLSAMAEDDRISKLRIGRENLISFPDQDLTDVDE